MVDFDPNRKESTLHNQVYSALASLVDGVNDRYDGTKSAPKDEKKLFDALKTKGVKTEKFIHSGELQKQLTPENLDGNQSTFSLDEKRAWAHFCHTHGLVTSKGGYLFLKEDVALAKASASLKEAYQFHRNRPNPAPQEVFIKVEDWNALFQEYGVAKQDQKKFQQDLINQLHEIYSVNGSRLNIKFSFQAPQAGPYKIVMLSSNPNSYAGGMLVAAGRPEDHYAVIESLLCTKEPSVPSFSTKDDIRFSKATTEQLQLRDKAQALLIFKQAYFEIAIQQGYFPSALEVKKRLVSNLDFWELKERISDWPQGVSGEEEMTWLLAQEGKILEDPVLSYYFPNLDNLSEYLIYQKAQELSQSKGETATPEAIIREISQDPIFQEIASLSFIEPYGTAIECETDAGNKSLSGVTLMNALNFSRRATMRAEKSNYSISSDQLRIRLGGTMAHEIGHMLGLNHHFVRNTAGSPMAQSTVIEPIMLYGSYAEKNITKVSEYAFLPEEQEYLELILGHR